MCIPTGGQIHVTGLASKADKRPGETEPVALGDPPCPAHVLPRSVVFPFVDRSLREPLESFDPFLGDGHGLLKQSPQPIAFLRRLRSRIVRGTNAWDRIRTAWTSLAFARSSRASNPCPILPLTDCSRHKCVGPDSNRRTPTGQRPQRCAVGLAWLPTRSALPDFALPLKPLSFCPQDLPARRTVLRFMSGVIAAPDTGCLNFNSAADRYVHPL